MPRAFLITNKRFGRRCFSRDVPLTSHLEGCHSNKLAESKDTVHVPDLPSNDHQGREHLTNANRFEEEPYSTPIDLSPSSPYGRVKGQSLSDDGDSDYRLTSSPGHEMRPDYSPKMDFRYDCSRHISMLLDYIGHGTGNPLQPKETMATPEPSAIRVLDFEDNCPRSSTPRGLLPLHELTNRTVPYEGLEAHERGGDMGDVHVCVECGKRYSTSSNLARHRQTHRSVSDKKARKCPHCDKVYVSMPAYSMHVRTHSQGCECPYCGKRFSRPWLLQGHIRTHTGEKPFACPTCGKCFADKSNLRAHIQTHSPEKPFICGRCGKAFALKSYLYKHEESSCMRGQRAKSKHPNFDAMTSQDADMGTVSENETTTCSQGW